MDHVCRYKNVHIGVIIVKKVLQILWIMSVDTNADLVFEWIVNI